MTDRPEPVPRLVEFGRTLRAAGVAVSPGQIVSYCEGLERLDPVDVHDLYWAGRCCLVSRSGDIATYDRVFQEFFGERAAVSRGPARPGASPPEAPPAPPAIEAGGDDGPTAEQPAGAIASSLEILRRKPFSECTPEELAAVQELIAELALHPPRRPGRRGEPHRRGPRPDPRRTLRRSLRSGGELIEPSWRRRRSRPRRLVMLLDVSGSMTEYSRAMLQFAYSLSRSGGQVETFCFATRLSRITEVLDRKDPDLALAEASEAVVDWDGGTRIGDAIGEFIRAWGRRGMARGAVVVICSDGLERGDPSALATEMERLARLAHRIVWVNPLAGDPAYEPLARGMHAALPFVDEFLPGHDLASLEALASLLPALRGRGRGPVLAPQPQLA